MKIETKKKLTRYLLIAQISIYAFIVLHSIAWHVLGIHVLTKLCPFFLRDQLGSLEFNLNILFWFLVFCSTLLFGRAFCAWGCMFGAYQDFVSRLAKKLKIKPLKSKVGKWLIATIVALLLTCYVLGNSMFWPTLFWFSAAIIVIGVLIWMLVEKKSASEKFITIPKYIFFGWYLGGIIAAWISLNVFAKGITFVFEKYKVLDDSSFIWGFLTFVAIIVAIGVMLGAKRFFCRYLCPVGLVLRFISAIPFPYKYKVRVTSEACSHCGKCNSECIMDLNPMDEINKSKVIENPNCINCLACVSKCPKNVLDFTTEKKASDILNKNQK
jgi:polyferredoxin